MVKYALLLKPTVSNWPTVPKQVKLVLALCTILLVSCLIIFARSRSLRIAKLYSIQTTLADLLDTEMKYINERPIFIGDRWLRLENLDGHVYSAYFDIRPEVIDTYSHSRNEIPCAIVRMIAILPMNIDKHEVDCIYKHANGSGPYMYKRKRVTSMKPIEENWNLQYSAFFVVCDVVVPEDIENTCIINESQLPESVTIALHNTEVSTDDTNFVDIRYPIMGMSMLYEPPENFMAVCVPVFHHAFNRPLDLIEFVEYYLLLGATHFTFYNSSVSPEVDQVFRYYAERETATILSWQLSSNYVFEKTLRHEGLFAGLNDCLYRNTFYESYRYIANFGIDEFLVPKIHNNFTEMMEYLDRSDNHANPHASFLFRNVFFYTMYQDDVENKDPNVPYLYTQAKTTRLKKPHEPGYRSKYIVRGLDAIELGNYNVWELRRSSSTFPKLTDELDEVAVEPEVALSHHYAPCEAEETGCYLKPIEIDKTAHKFTNKLGPKVATTCIEIFGKNGCPVVKKEPPA